MSGDKSVVIAGLK